jgi:outer membrane protein assembly factor BamB
MGPQGRGRPMQVVELDEAEQYSAASLDDPRAGPLWDWLHQRPWLALTAGAFVAALLVSFVVVAPQFSANRERLGVLGAAEFDGAVRSLSHAPRERWSAVASPSMRPLLAEDVVVVAVDDPTSRLVGLDAITGDVRWELGPFTTDGAPIQECTVAGSRVVCILGLGGRGLRPPSRLVVIDPAAGGVEAIHEIEGRWVEIAAAGDDVVLAGWLPDGLGVVRVDPSGGVVRWRADTSSRAHPRASANVGLVVAGGTVLASSSPSYLVLRLDDGRELPLDVADDLVRLRADGVYVRTRYMVRAGAVGATSTLTDANGQVLATLQGEGVEPTVRDPSSPRQLTVEGTTEDAVLRAYLDGSEPAWESDDGAGSVLLDAGGRVLLRNEAALVALDASTGTRAWQLPIVGQPRTMLSRGVFTDGERVAVLAAQLDGPPGLAAVRLDDGESLWQVVLPDDTRRVLRLGTQLYVQADERLVALR